MTTSEWIVLVGLLTVFTAMIWHATDSIIITSCFLPLTAILGLLSAYGVQVLDSQNILSLSEAALIGVGTGIGAILSTVIVVSVLRAVPQPLH